MSGTVLVLPAGQTGTVVIKCLQKDPSLRIIAADTNFLAPGLHLADKGYMIPSVTEPAFYDKIQDIIVKESVDVIFPCDNIFTYTLANHALIFSKTCVKVLASEPETLDKCLDKWKTYEYLNKIVPMPRNTIEVNTEHVSSLIGFPAIIKPRDGSGSKNIHKLEDITDLNYYIKNVPNPIVQEFIDGQHYSTDILVNSDGKLISAVTRRRIEASDGMPIKSVIEPRNELLELVKEVCDMLRFFGVINIQTTIDKDSKPKLLEINPRVGHGVILSVAAGCNLPLEAVYLALGKPIERGTMVARPLYMSRYYEEIFIAHPFAVESIHT